MTAAVIKAARKGDTWLADRVYSGVPAGLVGRDQRIEIGHMSGKSNVVWWLESRGYTADPILVDPFAFGARRDELVEQWDDPVLG